MANKTFQTRLQLKYDSYSNWESVKNTFKPLKGEVCIVAIGETESAGFAQTPPQVLFKVGDGANYFKDLNWVSAKAADVHEWAKKTESDFIAWAKTNIVTKEVVESHLGNYYTKTETNLELDKKVDKESGKSLVSDTEITKLASVSEGANKVENVGGGKIKIDGTEVTVYEHPEKHEISEVNGLQDALNGKVNNVSASDKSMTVDNSTKDVKVAVKLSADADNALSLAEDGLKVVIPSAAEYSIQKAENAGEYAAVYNLTKNGAIVGASINIPKDMVVESGEVVTNPAGKDAGTYIKLVLANATNDVLYIPVDSLIEYVTSGSTAGDMVVINISDDHKVTATITDGSITLTKLSTEIQTAIGKAHTHDNKALLDTYTQTEENLKDAVDKKHSHENASVLDGITSAKVEAWDKAEANAKKHADDLNTAMDARVKTIEDWSLLILNCGSALENIDNI